MRKLNQCQTKMTNEMNFDELMDYWSGRMIISIGEGNFRSTIAAMIQSISHDAYQRGVDSTKKGKK